MHNLSKILLCPYCNTRPTLDVVGSNKDLLVFRCNTCRRQIVKYDEARSTVWGAIRVWNKKVKMILKRLK